MNIEEFPFSEDYVIHRCFTDYRKSALDIDNSITEYLGIEKNIAKENRARDKAERRANESGHRKVQN